MNNFSTTPAEQYYACPYCLIKVNVDATRANMVGLFLTAFGSIILALVSWLTWYDVTTWGKDIPLIFFGPRTGEAIGLGIGMKIIYYFLIGLALLLSGLLTFLRRRRKVIDSHSSASALQREKGLSKCPYQFGYLKKFDQNASIPDGCLRCSRKLECSGFIE